MMMKQYFKLSLIAASDEKTLYIPFYMVWSCNPPVNNSRKWRLGESSKNQNSYELTIPYGKIDKIHMNWYG